MSAAVSKEGFPSLAGLPSAPAATNTPSAADLAAVHSWSAEDAQTLLWSEDAAVMLDAVRDCGATPDWVNATDDDGAAITRCLAQHRAARVLFVPRGEFLLWSPLVLRAGLRLVGAGKHNAALVMRARPSPLVPVGTLLYA